MLTSRPTTRLELGRRHTGSRGETKQMFLISLKQPSVIIIVSHDTVGYAVRRLERKSTVSTTTRQIRKVAWNKNAICCDVLIVNDTRNTTCVDPTHAGKLSNLLFVSNTVHESNLLGNSD